MYQNLLVDIIHVEDSSLAEEIGFVSLLSHPILYKYDKDLFSYQAFLLSVNNGCLIGAVFGPVNV